MRFGFVVPYADAREFTELAAVGTVDRLSGGRAVMSVGLGAVHDGRAAVLTAWQAVLSPCRG